MAQNNGTPGNKPKKPRYSFAEQFFPARPKLLWKRARRLAITPIDVSRIGPPSALNTQYVRWLRRESMLEDANKLAINYSGQGRMWQNPFAKPRPRSAVRQASVWYTTYPISLVTKPGESILSTLADDSLWQTFQIIGIKGLHTGPMKRAGGIKGWKATPSIDGHFDRISTQIDDVFGYEVEFQHMCEVAAAHGAIIIDDIVPGHTGKGPDFRLAEMNYREYPGIYHMVEINPADWHLLPAVPKGQDSANIDVETEEMLKKRGYIIGRLPRVIFYEPGVKETNWSVTKAVRGVDGIKRRWVYLHYFKDGQPSINWLDPSFAGMKLVIGDALHSLGELGTKALRLDANGFLGIEKSSEDEPAWSEGHPLSGAANQLISSMVRKLGGFTFQELNLSIDHIKTMSELGADLSYDFVNRPAYHHALATADTRFLQLTLRTSLQMGVDPASLIHAMQNHDELTYELVHFWTLHKDDSYDFRGEQISGMELRRRIRQELREKLTGPHAPYNLPFTENGIACTTASIITAVLGISSFDAITDDDRETIKQMHLLLVMFNAMQPGVFALSGWDLTGALTIDPTAIEDLLSDGDTRWINRGAFDLMGDNPTAKRSTAGMPLAPTLYGSLPDQLQRPDSFASQLKHLLDLRESLHLATAHQLDICQVSDNSVLAMLHRLPQSGELEMTVLNFSGRAVTSAITSSHIPDGWEVKDLLDPACQITPVNNGAITLDLQPYQGRVLLLTAQDNL